MQFKTFKQAVQQQFDTMQQHPLFRVTSDKNLLWQTYLGSFPPGTDPIYRERTEHDCQCCKQFIRAVGDVVAIINRQVVSIWDIEIGGYYQVVADALAAKVKAQPIENIFFHQERTAGTDRNVQLLLSGETQTWEHFFINVPAANYSKDPGPKLSEARSTFDVMRRGLSEITIDALETVLELIAQNSLYRGEENTFAVEAFLKLKREFDTATDKDIFCWSRLTTAPAVSRIRNTSIGTLLTDISEGVELEKAVKSFEAKVAPTNYKRPTALVTASMVEKARQEIESLGLTSAIERRHARVEDLTINNILFANRESRKKMSVFDEIAVKPITAKSLDKVESVDIETFVKEILPRAESIELMFENKHRGNLVSLIAPVDPAAGKMFKWHNNFSWSYAGEVADSIKERVKRAGGNVTGDVRISLSWFNYDDLDLHVIEPGRYEVFYGSRGRLSPAGGTLDVDMNAAGRRDSRSPVENICYQSKDAMKEGIYKIFVKNYSKQETSDVGFEVEMEVEGVVNTFSYAKPVRDQEVVQVAAVNYSKKTGITIIESLPLTQATKEVWGIPTQQFHKVNMVMFSPNYWDEKASGNKHYFFMLDDCRTDTSARGFYNEFLSENLSQHRKVFEILGSKMKVEPTENQLSGLGFSSTQRNEVFCRVSGSFSRTIKITF